MLYPGIVDIDNEDQEITLREAARCQSVTKSDVMFCGCKKGCRSKSCLCRKGGSLCNSRCHKGQSCFNVTEGCNEAVVALKYPAFGGKLTSDGQTFNFANTCPVDNWLCLFRAVFLNYPTQFNAIIGLFQECMPDMCVVMQGIKNATYENAKMSLAKLNKLVSTNRTYNFYGTETNRFLTFLKTVFVYKSRSTCSSEYCTTGNIELVQTDIPSIDASCTMEVEFHNTIKDWFFSSWKSDCSRTLVGTLPPEESIKWNTNSSS